MRGGRHVVGGVKTVRNCVIANAYRGGIDARCGGGVNRKTSYARCRRGTVAELRRTRQNDAWVGRTSRNTEGGRDAWIWIPTLVADCQNRSRAVADRYRITDAVNVNPVQ